MISVKKRRTDLTVPPYIKEHWDKGTKQKEELAQMLKDCNFIRETRLNPVAFYIGASRLYLRVGVTSYIEDEFVATMERVVVKLQEYIVQLDEGWFSEQELREELKWST